MAAAEHGWLPSLRKDRDRVPWLHRAAPVRSRLAWYRFRPSSNSPNLVSTVRDERRTCARWMPSTHFDLALLSPTKVEAGLCIIARSISRPSVSSSRSISWSGDRSDASRFAEPAVIGDRRGAALDIRSRTLPLIRNLHTAYRIPHTAYRIPPLKPPRGIDQFHRRRRSHPFVIDTAVLCHLHVPINECVVQSAVSGLQHDVLFVEKPMMPREAGITHT
jgi:hypothetical protein